MLRTPAMQLVMYVALVKEHGDHLVLPRICRTGGKHVQFRKARGHRVDVARMSVVKHDAFPALVSLADTREAAQGHHRHADADQPLVEGIAERVARRHAGNLAVDAEAHETRIRAEAA